MLQIGTPVVPKLDAEMVGTRSASESEMRIAVVEPSQAVTLERVYRAFERDRRVDARAHPLSLLIADGTLVIEGEVEDDDAKDRAVQIAREQPSVRRVVDRITTSYGASLRRRRPRPRRPGP